MGDLSFVSTNGTTLLFDGTDGLQQAEIVTGMVTQPNELVIDPRVGADGGVLVTSRKGPKRLLLTVKITGTANEQLARWATACAAFNAGGELLFDGPNGVRTLRQVVLEDPSRSQDEYDSNWFTCSLVALDPWWYGAADTVAGTFTAPTPWDAAIPWDSAIPWNGGASVDVDNIGDTAAACTVVVTGAATQVSMSVNGVGGWESNTTLGSGDYFSVSSVPGEKGPHLGPHGYHAGADSAVDWSLLTEWSDLFELPAGMSSLVFGASGTDGSSAWAVHWSPRFLTP